MDALLAADRDQQFRDWSVSVLLRTITENYDPETLQRTETSSDVEIDALLGTLPRTPTPGAAATHHTQLFTITVKREELPTLAPHPFTRLVWNDAEYEVTESTDNPTAQLTTLTVRRINTIEG